MTRATLLMLLLIAPAAFAGQTAVPAPAPAVGPPATAACSTDEQRQFDFWLGEWEVTGKAGKIVGHSRIEKTLLGCVIAEHWTSTSGAGANDGKSYNLFNNRTRRWEQFWVDARGNRLMLTGGLVDGRMVLTAVGEVADAKSGIHQRDRVSWTPNADGSVRQWWESSSDDGKTWTTTFDGLYRHPPR